MKHSEADQCLALAGLLQATDLVQKLAYGKPVDVAAMQTMISSIFSLDAPSVPAVYGSSQGLATGLKALKKYLTVKPGPEQMGIIRYVLNILNLERKLSQRKDLLELLGHGIEAAKPAEELTSEDALSDEAVINQLANLYQKTISTLTPRIMVNGEPRILAQADQVNRIRTMLLSGIRSAVLWRQCGGNKISLLFRRRAVITQTEILLQRLS